MTTTTIYYLCLPQRYLSLSCVTIIRPRPYGVAVRGGYRDPETRKARLGPEVNKRLEAYIPDFSPSKGPGKALRPKGGYYSCS